MNENSDEMIRLVMEGGRADGLWVRHVRVEEGLCRLPQAEIEIVAKKAIAMDDLEGYVEQPAALEISRIDVGTTRRTTRWFSGIVTSVEHEGRVLASQGGSVFGYRMTVSPNLVNLAYSQSDFQYADTPAIDVVKKILDQYNVAYKLDDRLPDAAKEKHDYFQAEESDYAFLLGVLSACGLCFSYRMPRQEAGAKNVKGPMLHIGRGTGLPYASDFAENGNGSDPLHSFSCDRERSDATYRRMDHWRMGKSIGTDRVEVGFVDRNGEEAFGSAGAENSLRRMRLNGTLSAASDKESVGRVTEEYLKALALDTVRWQGRTSCLEAMAGCRLEIHGFFDETGGANDNPVEALVCSTVLDGSQALPSDLVGADEENVTRLGIDLACMDGRQVNDDLGAAAIGKRDTLDAMALLSSQEHFNLSARKPPVKPPKRKPKPLPRISIVQAIVTDRQGKYDKVGEVADLEKGYTFKAVSVGKNSMSMTVRLVMPVGGIGQGLFRVPRIGDRILVTKVIVPVNDTTQTDCYLQGYLPDANMPFSPDVNESTAGEEVTKAPKSKEDKNPGAFTIAPTARNSEMLALRYRSVGTTKTEQNKVGIRRGTSGQNTCSELAFYNTHVGREYDPWMRERAVDFGSGNVWEEKDGKRTEVPAKAFDPYTKTKDSDRMSFKKSENVLANFQSVGDMQISANKSLDINARDITISGPGWKEFQRGAQNKGGRVVLRDINEFEVRANQRIRLMVGSNSIVIDKSGILLNAARWGQVSNPLFSSSVSVVGCRGVTVTGLNVDLTGALQASMGDTAGGKFSACAGMSGISGSLIKNATMTGVEAWLRALGGLAGSTAVALGLDNTGANKRQNPETSEARISPYGGLLGDLVSVGVKSYDIHKMKKSKLVPTQDQNALLAMSVLAAVADAIDSVAMIVRIQCTKEAKGGSWETWERPFGASKISRSDIFVIFSLALKLGAWVAAWGWVTRALVRSIYSTTVTIKPEELLIEAPKLDMFAVEVKQNNGVLAGMRGNPLQRGEDIDISDKIVNDDD